MPVKVVFEFLFARRAADQQPIRVGIADAVAEQQVQAPGNLVDEVVHVAVERAVVIAREEHLLAVVQKDPAGEVNRVYPPEIAPFVDVAGAVIDDPQQEDDGRKPEPSRLQMTQHDIRVGDVMILQRGNAFAVPGLWAGQDFRIAGLVAPQQPKKYRHIQQHQRARQYQHQRDADQVQ